MRFFIFVSFLASFALNISSVHAQPVDAANQSSQQIIQQFEQQRLDQELERTIEREQDALKNNLDQPDPIATDEGPCITINQIDVKGAITIKPSKIEPVLTCPT